MRVIHDNDDKGAVVTLRRWLARAGSAASPALALATCLLMPAAHALEKAVQAHGAAVTVGDAAAPANPASAQGNWNFVMKTPVGDRKVSFKFSVDGSTLKGTMTDEDGSSEIFKGSVEGNTLKWSAKVSKPMSMTLDFVGVLNGDSISGGAKSMLGTAKFIGQRA